LGKEFFNKTYCLEVWGDYACFTRPEMKVERVSYDVITPSAARAIFEAIFWKPAIQWKIKKIEVLNPIRWISIRRNEVSVLASSSTGICIDELGNDGKPKYRQQKAGLFLKNVRYRLYAELVFIPVHERKKIANEIPEYLISEDEKSGLRKEENPGKYNAMFERRAKKGQCFNQPYLGCREFSCSFMLIDNPDSEAQLKPSINETRDLGFMLYDMDFIDVENIKPAFFRVNIENGVITVPDWGSEEVRR